MTGTDRLARPMLVVCLALIALGPRSSHAEGSDPKQEAAKGAIPFCDHIQREPNHHVWGCSPVKGDDGRYHLFGARFGNPFKTAWRSDSHIVHYVSDTPQGPFTFVEVVYRGERERKGQWNYFGVHNPTIKKVDGNYVLFFIANSNKGGKPVPANQSIGMMVADSPSGPWSAPRQVLKPSDDPGHWTYQSGNGVCNPAFIKGLDGRYYLYYKSAKARYGVAIADKLEGPYVHYPDPITQNDRTIEDGYAFIWDVKVYLLTTDNHGIIQPGGGLLWESKDGIHFGLPTRAYYTFDHYVSQEQYPRTHGVKGRPIKSYCRIVRPQILMENGRPAWLYAPSGACQTGRVYSDCHVFKILSDEEMRDTDTERTNVPARRFHQGRFGKTGNENNRKWRRGGMRVGGRED